MNLYDVWPFALAAVALVGAFSASLWRAGSLRPGAASRMQALALTLALPLAAGALYAVQGEPRALAGATASPHAQGDLHNSVQRLSERLQRQPEDLDGWLMLARSHNALGRHADAAAAYERAAERLWDDADALAAWIETRLLAADRRFDARTHELVERAVTIAPAHPDVLLFRALAAFDRDEPAAAAQALRALRDHHAPGSPDRAAIDAALDDLAPARDPPGGAGR